MSWLALSDSFEYLCYGSMNIRNILILTVRGQSLCVRTSTDVRFGRIKTVPALKGLKRIYITSIFCVGVLL